MIQLRPGLHVNILHVESNYRQIENNYRLQLIKDKRFQLH